MSKKYKIIELKLTPVTPFFFGKENQSDLGNKNDYFQLSQEFPQQTTLLGLLRHKILRDNGINLDAYEFSDTYNQANLLIGDEGFVANNNKLKNYGKINSISPCFIIDEKNNYLWVRDHELIKNKTANEELCISNNNTHLVWHNSDENADVNYLNKHHFSSLLNDTFKNDVIHTANYVGSYKGGNKINYKEDSFFIMQYRHLCKYDKVAEINEVTYNKAKPMSFGFLACIEEDCHISCQPDFMSMGKEQSFFKVETQNIKENLIFEPEKLYEFDYYLKIQTLTNSKIIKCTLLSDARISNNDLEKLSKISIMQITNQQRLRYIKRKTGKFFMGARPHKETCAFNLIAKGSVFFIENKHKDDFKVILTNAKDFLQIGYNYMIFNNAKTI